MNDRYLFRAKRIDNGEWVCGSYVFTFCEDKNGIVVGVKVEKHWIVEESGNMVWVDKDTICQCTGLKDKNGKLIWENDIVKDNVIFGSVSWDGINARFVIDDIYDGYQDYSDWWNEVQVIGNIFDNPELLNK